MRVRVLHLEARDEVVQRGSDALAQPLVGRVGRQAFEPYGEVSGRGLLEDGLRCDSLQWG